MWEGGELLWSGTIYSTAHTTAFSRDKTLSPQKKHWDSFTVKSLFHWALQSFFFFLCFAESCHQDGYMSLPLLQEQTSGPSGADRQAPINPTISHSASQSSMLSASAGSETDQFSSEFAGSPFGSLNIYNHISKSKTDTFVEHIVPLLYIKVFKPTWVYSLALSAINPNPTNIYNLNWHNKSLNQLHS